MGGSGAPAGAVRAGCYRCEPRWHGFVSIAANELLLLDELVPFLMARSGQTLAELSRGAHRVGPWSW